MQFSWLWASSHNVILSGRTNIIFQSQKRLAAWSKEATIDVFEKFDSGRLAMGFLTQCHLSGRTKIIFQSQKRLAAWSKEALKGKACCQLA